MNDIGYNTENIKEVLEENENLRKELENVKFINNTTTTFTLDNKCEDIVTVSGTEQSIDIRTPIMTPSGVVTSGKIHPLITIKGQKNKRMKIIGINDSSSYRSAHTLIAAIRNKDDNEISLDTMLMLTHKKSIGDIEIDCIPYQLISTIEPIGCYEDVNLTKPTISYKRKTDNKWYRFRNSIIIDENDEFVIYIINPKEEIQKEKIKFGLEYIHIKNEMYRLVELVDKLKKNLIKEQEIIHNKVEIEKEITEIYKKL